MTEHNCKTLTAGCRRCDLNRDEMEADWLDHLRAAKVIKGAAMNPNRRPGTRWLLLEVADTLWEHAQEVQAALSGSNRRSVDLGDAGDGIGPQMATADDVIEGRARYRDTPGGHADRKTVAKEATDSTQRESRPGSEVTE